ncbi:bifunctional adenosylcobinamide kinase/adenosylcobinamide-phosphate guanylyltransferase [Thermanaerovibrio acidaminovorans]|uniref:Adenosylcobinamide kinase n=1 Tax=Thermanaerovibrio acidaminovorans (strain ATCC 49978 / DSM 6589 / Su883) TaxID=525903 RepID=D1B7E2_THEAS|nr:bifunctional adenosylcobinamide kinase/adenosylcobinamide-phosphate guanylyltransferase [Thermanaerovibrio acidaminovorans]ACZ19933.1 Adenosylcobinamide-phosphateguanylyltransferase [Thermanaerovibrio acidaminovorans DSM 6589]
MERILILGGVRSGKSRLAEVLTSRHRRVLYCATAEALDPEMEERVRLHRERRPPDWETWEGAPEEIFHAVSSFPGAVLVDCLTVWLSRICLADPSFQGDRWQDLKERALEMTRRLFSLEGPSHLVVVSNEVGFSLVPPNRMGRRFQELQGMANALGAAACDRVALVVAGVPLWIKGGDPHVVP